MKVAIIYDRINKWGGAERILLALNKLFPDAPLFTSVYNPKKATWANVFKIKTSFLQNFPFATSYHELYAGLMPLAFESFNFTDYDLVISVTSEAAKGIMTSPKTKHICICLTPTRYLWSGYDEYFKNDFFKFLTKPIILYLRFWDKIAAQRPDVMIAISENVQERIKKYYDCNSVVIYPPVTLSQKSHPGVAKSHDRIFSEKDAIASLQHDNKNYFLVVSRLSRFTQYKRVDIAIEAANKLNINLKIVGDGDIDYFRKKASKNIEFLGHVTDQELASYYKNCKALIFPGNEDFGLVMVEAQIFGKPVVAFRGGGALEIIKEGKTGEFFNQQTVGSLIKILQRFKETSYNSKDCISNAQKFSQKRFEKELTAIIDRS